MARRSASTRGILPRLALTSVEPHRAMAEAGLTLASLPLLYASPAKGDDHPVLVIPGISGGRNWCAPLRTYLHSQGYRVERPTPLSTRGRISTVTGRMVQRVEDLALRHRTPVSVIGWSVGGCFARAIALEIPEHVRQIITLGTPVRGWWYSEIPQAADRTMPVPATAIYSFTDPYFPWRECRQPRAKRAENISVPSSHLGMATNPFTYHVITDRLAQPQGQWRPYARRGQLTAGA